MDITNLKTPNFLESYSTEILLIGICIIIILFLIRLACSKKKKSEPSKKVLISNRNRVYKALNSAGIELHDKETFDNPILFDSIDKINTNFEIFMDTFIPLIDMETTNKIFKEFNINTHIQKEVTEKQLNTTVLFNNPFGFIERIILLVYSSKNQTDLILLGICCALLMKLQNNLIRNHRIIYFGDYNQETTDFILYFVPPTYIGDVSRLKDNDNILDMNKNEINDTIPFKLSLFNQLDKLLKSEVEKYKLAIKQPANSLYDTDKIEFINDLHVNREYILINCRLYLISLFSLIYDPSTLITLDILLSPKPTRLSLYIIDYMFNSNYYTPSYYKYITYNLDISKLNNNNKLGFALLQSSLIAKGMSGSSSPVSNIVVSLPPTLSAVSTTSSNSEPTATIVLPTSSLPITTTSPYITTTSIPITTTSSTTSTTSSTTSTTSSTTSTTSSTMAPTMAPTIAPTIAPTMAPTEAPTMAPTEAPITTTLTTTSTL